MLVETHAGETSAFTDDEYQGQARRFVGSAHNVWGNADMVVKVKEPAEKEYDFFRPGLTLFHLSAPGAAARAGHRPAAANAKVSAASPTRRSASATTRCRR